MELVIAVVPSQGSTGETFAANFMCFLAALSSLRAVWLRPQSLVGRQPDASHSS